MRDAIFLMGLPGAGKTTVIQREFAGRTDLLPGTLLIWNDSDEIKRRHPFYLDADPSALHEWSAAVSIEEFKRSLEVPRDTDVILIVDGTGAKPAFVQRIREAQLAGFRVVVFFVEAPLPLCIERLKTRERKVPLALLQEKLDGIVANWPTVRAIVDEYVIFDGVTGERRAAITPVAH